MGARAPLPLEDLVLEALADAVVATGPDGRISAWSGAAARLTGYSAAEAVGRTVTWMFSELAPEAAEELRDLAGAPRLEAVMDVRRKRRPALRAAVTARREGERTTWLLKPMGDWLDPTGAAGQAFVDWNRRLGAIVRSLFERVAEDPAALDSSETLAPLLVQEGRRLFPDTDCLLSVVPHNRHDHFLILAGAGPWAARQVGRTWPWQGTVAGLAMSQRRPIETALLMERSNLRHTLEEGAIHSARLVPLWATRALPDGRHALGTIGFYRGPRAYFTPYERRLIAEFARLVSLAIQRTELARAAHLDLERLRVGVDVALDLAASLNQREVLRRLVTRAAAALDADRAALLRVEGASYTVEDAVDSAGVAGVGRRVPIAAVHESGRPVLELAIRRRLPVLASAYEVEGMDEAYTSALATLRHTLILPLVLSGEVPAILAIGRRREPAFGADDIATLQLLGNVAVLALRNAGLFAEAEAANRVRSDFLNMAAHELRTPLTVIHGYLSMLVEGSFGPVPERWARPLDTLTAKTEELGHLVEDLLLASRLESGRVPATISRIDLVQVVAEAVERARPRNRLARGRLRARLPEAPLAVHADAEHIGRIMDNLLNNALTYVRAGRPPSIEVSVEREGEEVVVRVADRGRGIPPERVERIFERFYRLDEDGGERLPGTGLGLYISRELAARHGGTVNVEWSAPGRGSRFALRLPLSP